MSSLLSDISAWILPLLVTTILVVGFLRKVPIYNTFVDGAKDGFGTSVRLIPHLVAMMVAVQVFRTSGAMDILVSALRPVLQVIHLPGEIAPLALLRPFSGQASLAFMVDVFQKHGPDSWLGSLASTVQASTDTTLYVITVYFGSVGIRNIRYALKVGLLADLASVIGSLIAVYLLLGSPM